MANKARGEIELQVNGGDPVIWRLRWRDIAEIEHALEQLEGKKSTWWQFRARMQEWSIRDFALVLWAGLRHTGKFKDPDELLEVADFTLQDAFLSKFSDQIVNALPDDLKKKFQEAQTEKPQSGASPST
jgi:hypothetical protein